MPTRTAIVCCPPRAQAPVGGPLVFVDWRRARAPRGRAHTPRCDALIVRCRESERPPPSGGGRTLDEFGSASAADLEDLVAALRAGALQRRLAVLHRDPLRVLDFDLHLVLDAVGFGHGAGSSSVQRGGTGTLVPHPHLTFNARVTDASDPSLLLISDGPSRR